MKHQAKKPKPFGAVVNRSPVYNFRLRVSEQRTEQKDFSRHPADCAQRPGGIFHGIVLDPGKAFPLAAGRGDAEGNGGFRPPDDTVNKAKQKNRQYKIWRNPGQNITRNLAFRNGCGRQGDRQNRDEG